MKFIRVLTLWLFSISAFSQVQVSNFDKNKNDFYIYNHFETDDLSWFNIFSVSRQSNIILVSDGTVSGTTFYNFNGLTFLPKRIIEVTKFKDSYYLLVETETDICIVKTQFINNKFYSNVVQRFNQYNLPKVKDKFIIKDSRLFFFQKTQRKIFEIIDTTSTEIFTEKEAFKDIDGTLLDFLFENDQLIVYSIVYKPLGLSEINRIEGEDRKIINLPSYITVKDSDWYPYFCDNPPKVIATHNTILIFSSSRFFSLDFENLKFVEPIKRISVYDLFQNEDKVFLIGSDSTSIFNSKLYQFNKTGDKITEKTIPTNSVYKIYGFQNDYIYFLRGCQGMEVISYNLSNESLVTHKTNPFFFSSFINNRLYFSYDGNLMMLEEDKISKVSTLKGYPERIFYSTKTNRNYSLILSNDSLKIINYSFNNYSDEKLIPYKEIFEKSKLYNFPTNDFYQFYFDNNKNLFFNDKRMLKKFDGTTIRDVIDNENKNVYYPTDFATFKQKTYFLDFGKLYKVEDNKAILLKGNGISNTNMYFSHSFGDKFLLRVYNNENEVWVSDGTPNNTKTVIAKNLANGTALQILGEKNNALLYLTNNKYLWSFDGENEKLIHTFGYPFYFALTDGANFRTNENFYFFESEDKKLIIKTLNSNQKIEDIGFIFTDNPIKESNTTIYRIGQHSFYLSNYDFKEQVLIEVKTNSHEILATKFKSDFFKHWKNISFEDNEGNKYIHFWKNLLKWYSGDQRDVDENIILHWEKNKQIPTVVAKVKTKDPNWSSINFMNLSNDLIFSVKTFNDLRMWQYDKVSKVATQFISEKDGVRFYKYLNNTLYLNVCKDGECYLYGTNGTQAETYKLTKNPLVVADIFEINNETYIYASNSLQGLQFWKIIKENKESASNLFSFKSEPHYSLKDFEFLNIEQEIPPIIIYPNPFIENITIDMNGNSFLSAEIYNIYGQKIFETTRSLELSQVEINNFLKSQPQNYFYYFRINTNQTSFYKRIIKL